ncbi:MAG: hypothetical protein EBU90_25285 [Proteobacteria bacterium]|nr:hypothetical protein [Pseudomonadota bacterium]
MSGLLLAEKIFCFGGTTAVRGVKLAVDPCLGCCKLSTSVTVRGEQQWEKWESVPAGGTIILDGVDGYQEYLWA